MQHEEVETPLARRLKARIRSDGPLRFDHYMDAALYDPEGGYYARGPDIGPSGDFSTSVRFEPFRRAVARLALDSWRRQGEPNRFRMVELGAGTGQLARAVTEAWHASGVGASLDYVTVDASPLLRARQARVPGVRSVSHARELDAAPSLVFGNEVLDALPVRRLVGHREGLHEVHVDVHPTTGRFVERVLPAADEDVARHLARLDVRPQPGQVCDVAMGLAAFVQEAARLADPGHLVFVDYGDPAHRLFSPMRLNGTLTAYRAHGKFFDAFDRVGEQDLTADVDLTSVTLAAEDAGMRPLGIASQGEWLQALGVEELGMPDDVRMVAGLANLGTAFWVLAFARGVEGGLPGFA